MPFTIVFKDEYRSDSTAIEEKYNLSKYKLPIVWSTKLYDSIGRGQLSEVIIYKDGREIFRSPLKGINGDYFENTMKQYLHSQANDTFNNLYLPHRFKLKADEKYLYAYNKINNELYVINRASRNVDTLTLNEDLVKKSIEKQPLQNMQSVKAYRIYKPYFSAYNVSNNAIYLLG
ncbi:MAG TPA: hypothetical protein VN721_01120 [Flavipsychrobacter sp.]|nr:hypothetical protein [Flavipsychrobacter sp.]